jgi:hypothetical protein
LPLWLDLYGFAQLIEHVGVGVWGCRDTSPYWAPDCLYDAIIRVAQSNESAAFQDKAMKLRLKAQESPGRYGAAQKVARLAGSGF